MLAFTKDEPLERIDQINAIANFKNATHFDLKTVKINLPKGKVHTVVTSAIKIIEKMKEFYKDYNQKIIDVLDFELEKFINPESRYAWIVKNQYGEQFVKKGLVLAEELQEKFNV